MSIKLPSGFLLVSLVLIANSPCAFAEEHQHLCPDMSDHEKVLNEGIRMHKIHGVSRSGRFGRFGYDLYGLDMSPTPSQSSSFIRDYTPSQREADSRAYWAWREKAAEKLPLMTLSERLSAEKQAEEFEEAGKYLPAQKLYTRLLEVRQSNSKAEPDKLLSTLKNLERVKLCQSGWGYLTIKQYGIAIDSLDKAVENLRSSSLDTLSKSILLTRMLDAFKLTDMSKGSSPGLTAEDATTAHKLKIHAEELLLTWKRELECLGMAQQLDRTAFNLEKDGQYAAAEKLYKQALLIKQKNLGPEDPESIAQNGDLARVNAARGNKSEACKYYEEALKELRKLPNPGRIYITMLESYGDMLDQMSDKQRAEKIYAEARTFHEQLSAAKN